MFEPLLKTLGWSLLLHLLLAIIVLWWSEQPVPVTAYPKAIEAFVYQPALPQLEPVATFSPAPEPVTPEPAPTTPSQLSQPTTPKEPERLAAKPVVATSAGQQSNAAPSLDQQSSEDVTHAIDPARPATSLAERSMAMATRHLQDVSTAALAASQLRPDLRDRPATTSKPQQKPAHAAANVLGVLSDGSFIEKVGDYCYQAKPGANLRSDIFSMKPVPCGEDKNAALYQRIMSKVGQDR